MLMNPHQPIPTLPGTRILSETFGLVGVQIEDPRQDERLWTITALLAPIRRRAVGGIRAKLLDEQGFVSFINQRDLELLLNLAVPGSWCSWLGKEYPGVNCPEEGWFGICSDEVDLEDDLQERELILRHQYGGVLPSNIELERRIHLEDGRDFEELLLLLWDKDPDTGFCPDARLETIRRRWAQVERSKVTWSPSTYTWIMR